MKAEVFIEEDATKIHLVAESLDDAAILVEMALATTQRVERLYTMALDGIFSWVIIANRKSYNSAIGKSA